MTNGVNGVNGVNEIPLTKDYLRSLGLPYRGRESYSWNVMLENGGYRSFENYDEAVNWFRVAIPPGARAVIYRMTETLLPFEILEA